MILFILCIMALFNQNVQNELNTFPKPELLLYGKDIFYIQGEYLEDFPLGQLIENSKYSNIFNELVDTTCWSSACDAERNFIGDWVVENQILYLQKIYYCCSNREIDLRKIFKRKNVSKLGVKALWVNNEYFVTNYGSLEMSVFMKGDFKDYRMIIKNGRIIDFIQEY